MLTQCLVMFSGLAWLNSMIFGIASIATPQASPVSGVITRSHCCRVASERRIGHVGLSGSGEIAAWMPS